MGLSSNRSLSISLSLGDDAGHPRRPPTGPPPHEKRKPPPSPDAVADGINTTTTCCSRRPRETLPPPPSTAVADGVNTTTCCATTNLSLMDVLFNCSSYCELLGFFLQVLQWWEEGSLCNCAAGKLFGIPLHGTHSHAFVSSFMGPDEITEKSLKAQDGSRVCKDFVSLTQTWLSKLKDEHATRLSQKYGDDASNHPLVDKELWEQAVEGMKKGRLFGFGYNNDIDVVLTGTSTQGGASSSSQEIEVLKTQVQELLDRDRSREKQYEDMATLIAKLSQSQQFSTQPPQPPPDIL